MVETLKLGVGGEIVSIFPMGVSTVEVEPPTPKEEQAIEKFKKVYEDFYARLSPLAAEVFGSLFKRLQADGEWDKMSLVELLVGVAKARFERPITFPCQRSSLCLAPLLPQLINPTGNKPTVYKNEWKFTVSQGSDVYILGSSTDYYKPEVATEGQRYLFVIAPFGFLEFATTPKLDQFKFEAEGYDEWGVFFNGITYDIPMDKENRIYRHNVPRAIFTHPDRGIRLKAKAIGSGVVDLRVVGVAIVDSELIYNGIWLT